MRNTVLALSMILLVSGLVFPPLTAYTTVYLMLLTMLAGLALLSSRHWDVLGLPAFNALWLSLIFSLVAFFAVGVNMANFGAIAVLLPILAAPGAAFLLREEPQFTSTQLIAGLCLVGSLAAAAIAIYDVEFQNLPRAGGGNNPIHFGGISVMIGFMSLLGLFGTRSPWRFLFLLGPVSGLAAAVLSGSRGPILAGVVLAVLSVLIMMIWYRREKAAWIWFAIGSALSVAAMAMTGGALLGRFYYFAVELPQLLFAGVTKDASTLQRFDKYEAAWTAFVAKPIFGHGTSQLNNILFPEGAGEISALGSKHFHNDLADFAVAGGLFGIGAYVCLLAAPLFAHRIAQDRDIRRAVLLGGMILSVGYFVLGLTNAMFGILPQTTLYGLLLGVLVAIALEGRTSTQKPA